MKTYLLILLTVLFVASPVLALADELITMSNGMTCWRNNAGVIYGCSGGSRTGDSGFNDTRTGTRYEYINPNQAIDTRTGQPINTPNRQHNDDDDDD